MKKCEPGEIANDEYNNSFTINTDGCSVSKSSKVSAWPIFLQLNELPPHARKRHLFLAGVWVDNVHPPLNYLLIQTIQELRILYQERLIWCPNGTDKVTSRFISLICSVDSGTRPAVLNMTQYNGKYGCTFCYAEGTNNEGRHTYQIEKKTRKEKVSDRTDTEIREHMKEAYEKGTKIKGVKGLSAMMMLPKFDLALGPIVEAMHNLYLGVAKQHTSLLLFGQATATWYCGKPQQLAAINIRLSKIRPPDLISRAPRDISTVKQWKASEWRNWLLYYCIPCLENIIPRSHLDLLTSLSGAAYILNKNSISIEELKEADQLLRKYMKGFQILFGTKNMSFNIHLLSHLISTVKNWGPVWAHSAFPFKSCNKKIIDSITSPNGRPLQIAIRFAMKKFIEKLVTDPTVTLETQELVRSLLKSAKARKTEKFVTDGGSHECTIRNSEKKVPIRAGFNGQKLTSKKEKAIL